MDEFFTYAANYSFPMVLSVYLLVRLEGKINSLGDSIQELSKVISNLRIAIAK